MFQSVTVTNYIGDSLELPLTWPNDAGLLISSIDGISPGNVQVNSQDYAVLDGGVFNSSRIGTRNITIEFYYGFTPQIESARHRAYVYFPVKEQVRLDFKTDERWLSIWGWVESNETQIFSEQEKGQVSIVCPDPYFYEKDVTSYVFGTYIPAFEFPFSNESLTEPFIYFGEYGPGGLYNVDYNGDIEVGAIIRVRFLKDPEMQEIKIASLIDNKILKLNIADIESRCGITIQENGEIVYNSVRGQKDIYYEYFGKKKSIMNTFDVTTFPWMNLYPGRNQYTYLIDGTLFEGEYRYNDVIVSIEHRGAYGGV